MRLSYITTNPKYLQADDGTFQKIAEQKANIGGVLHKDLWKKLKSDDKKERVKTSIQKREIIRYLTDHASATTSELAELLEIKPTRLKTILYEMIADGIVVAEGGNRNRRYRLKS